MSLIIINYDMLLVFSTFYAIQSLEFAQRDLLRLLLAILTFTSMKVS